ncbi:MAG: hypothetical protein ABH811_00280 [archaeon]
MAETIFQYPIVTQFILPFLLIWTLVFAILQKTKLLGENKQLDAIIAFVIGLIFVGAIFPKIVVGNLILFLTVAIVVMFVGLLLWGFISGDKLDASFLKSGGIKWAAGIAVFIAVTIAVLWATGVEMTVFDWLFKQSWSPTFWTNFFFVAAIIGVLVVVLKSAK